MILGQSLVTNLVVAQEYKFLKKKLTLLHFENLTIRLHVFYTLNTHQILCHLDVIYYMINKPIFNA